MKNYDPKTDPALPPENRPFVPTADDPMCVCGHPRHNHFGDGSIADDRGEKLSDCKGFTIANDKSNAAWQKAAKTAAAAE